MAGVTELACTGDTLHSLPLKGDGAVGPGSSPALQGVAPTLLHLGWERGHPGLRPEARREVVGWQSSYLFLSRRAHRTGVGGQGDLSWLRLSCACACVCYWVLRQWAGLGMEVLNPMTERAFHGLGGNFTGVGVSCLSDNQMIPKGHASSYVSGFRFRSPPSHPVIPRSPADRRIS